MQGNLSNYPAPISLQRKPFSGRQIFIYYVCFKEINKYIKIYLQLYSQIEKKVTKIP